MQVDQRPPSVHRKSSLSLQAALPDGMTGNNFKTTDLFFLSFQSQLGFQFLADFGVLAFELFNL